MMQQHPTYFRKYLPFYLSVDKGLLSFVNNKLHFRVETERIRMDFWIFFKEPLKATNIYIDLCPLQCATSSKHHHARAEKSASLQTHQSTLMSSITSKRTEAKNTILFFIYTRALQCAYKTSHTMKDESTVIY